MSDERTLSPNNQVLYLFRRVRKAERDALLRQLFPDGIGPYEQEKVVARIRKHFPEVSRDDIYRMNPGQLVHYLKEVVRLESGSEADEQGGLSKTISPSEGGRLYGVSARTFVRWVKDGKIRAKKLTTKTYQIAVDDPPKLSR